MAVFLGVDVSIYRRGIEITRFGTLLVALSRLTIRFSSHLSGHPFSLLAQTSSDLRTAASVWDARSRAWSDLVLLRRVHRSSGRNRLVRDPAHGPATSRLMVLNQESIGDDAKRPPISQGSNLHLLRPALFPGTPGPRGFPTRRRYRSHTFRLRPYLLVPPRLLLWRLPMFLTGDDYPVGFMACPFVGFNECGPGGRSAPIPGCSLYGWHVPRVTAGVDVCLHRDRISSWSGGVSTPRYMTRFQPADLHTTPHRKTGSHSVESSSWGIATPVTFRRRRREGGIRTHGSEF